MKPWLRLVSLLLMGALSCPGVLSAATRLGLHVTDVELACWKQRAGVVTPGSLTPSCGTDGTAPATGAAARYRTNGDVQTNSPGDWDRILNRGNTFRTTPSMHRYSTGPAGCQDAVFAPTLPDQNHNLGEWLRDAAFVFLLTGDTSYRDAVRGELLAQAAEPITNWTDTSRWCGGNAGANPTFLVTSWLTKLLFGYDYLLASGNHGFSGAQLTTMNTWFTNAMNFWRQVMQTSQIRRWPNRTSGDYSVITQCNVTAPRLTHYGGWTVYDCHRILNNRAMSMQRFIGIAGVFFDNAAAKLEGKMAVKEQITFGTFSDGTLHDMERWEDPQNANEGWSYAGTIISDMMSIADAFARTSDLELYNFSTSDGMVGTQGGPKTLPQIIALHHGMVDGSISRYGTDNPANNGQPGWQIRSIGYQPATNYPTPNWWGVHDVWGGLPSNLFFTSTYIKNGYLRQNAGAPGYPTNPAGGLGAWGGGQYIYPGVLLMFGQLEEVVDPYNLNGGGPATIPAAPTNLRVVSP